MQGQEPDFKGFSFRWEKKGIVSTPLTTIPLFVKSVGDHLRPY